MPLMEALQVDLKSNDEDDNLNKKTNAEKQ